MMLTGYLPALAAAAAACYILWRSKTAGWPTICAKTAASLSFVLLCLAAMRQAGSPAFGWFVIAGQVLGFAGDVFLGLRPALRGTSSALNNTLLHMGFGAFAAGHLCFAAGIIVTLSAHAGSVVAAALAALTAATLISIPLHSGRLQAGTFSRDTLLYTAVIVFASSLPCLELLRGTSFQACLGVFFIGMLLFLASDIVLSIAMFGTRPHRGIGTLNLVLYYAAQAVLSLSLLLLA